MATYYLVRCTKIPGTNVLAGSLINSTTDAATYNALVSAGGALVTSADATVAAAAAVAQSARLSGANEAQLDAIMGDALNASTAIAIQAADLAATTTGKGAALIGVIDAGGIITATTVEAALAEIFAKRVQTRTVTITHADLTDAVAGEAQAINVGAVLPTGAFVLAHESNLGTAFSGGSVSSCKMDLGGTDVDAIIAQQDVFTGATTGPLSLSTGVHYKGLFSAEQLVATFTPDGGHTLAALTAGSIAITLTFVVP